VIPHLWHETRISANRRAIRTKPLAKKTKLSPIHSRQRSAGILGLPAWFETSAENPHAPKVKAIETSGALNEMIAVALLDIDGTLVDSNDFHAHAWTEAFAEAGCPVAFERVRPLLGMGGDKLLPAIDSRLSDDNEPGKTIARRRGEIFKARYLDQVRPFPAIRDLLLRLKQSGISCVVATSSKRDELRSMLRVAGITDLVAESATSEDVGESKPAPDIISVALKKAGVPGNRAVMLGDTRFDIEAARSANVATITFRSGGAPDTDLAQSVAIFDEPRALFSALAETSLSDIVHRGYGERVRRQPSAARIARGH
jgi:HAD superfamily hydrolase (TIGR01509 family)